MYARINQVHSLVITRTLTENVISQIHNVYSYNLCFEMFCKNHEFYATSPAFFLQDPQAVVFGWFAKYGLIEVRGVRSHLVCYDLSKFIRFFERVINGEAYGVEKTWVIGFNNSSVQEDAICCCHFQLINACWLLIRLLLFRLFGRLN
jgi:hypothetical protein